MLRRRRALRPLVVRRSRRPAPLGAVSRPAAGRHGRGVRARAPLRHRDRRLRRRRRAAGGLRRRQAPAAAVRAVGVGVGPAAVADTRARVPGHAPHLPPRRRRRRLRRARAAVRRLDPGPRRRRVRRAAVRRARPVRPPRVGGRDSNCSAPATASAPARSSSTSAGSSPRRGSRCCSMRGPRSPPAPRWC